MISKNISVVMATYNGGKFLLPQLASIANQTLQPAEFIVGDDQSQDDTITILQQYAQTNSVQWHINENPAGTVRNFKASAALANPENYIAFADQDDVWLPQKLEYSLASLTSIETPDTPAMVYADPQIINEDGIIIADSLWDIIGASGYRHKLTTILFGNPVSGCTMLINPVLAKYIKTIPDDFKINHDAWLTLCAYTFGRAAIVSDKIILYRQHGNNLTYSTAHQPQGRIRRRMNELKKAFRGSDDLFAAQFVLVRRFYEVFEGKMDAEKRSIFNAFLRLQKAGYFKKKLAFRKACKD